MNLEFKEVVPASESWGKVGGYLRQAIVEVAHEVGGQNVAMQAIQLGGQSERFPDAGALKYLEAVSPGAAESIIQRAEQIQKSTFKQERNSRSIVRRILRRR